MATNQRSGNVKTIVTTTNKKLMEKKTGERLATLEEHMSNQDKTLVRIDTKVDKLSTTLDTLVESLDKRYASKQVERIVYAMVAVVLIAVLGGILALLGLKAIHV